LRFIDSLRHTALPLAVLGQTMDLHFAGPSVATLRDLRKSDTLLPILQGRLTVHQL